MKSLAPHDRPREKLDRLGSGVLGDNELIAVILGHGFRRKSALEIAGRVLEMANGVHGLTRVTDRKLRDISGVGPAKAAQILAAVELGRRTLARTPGERAPLASPRDVFRAAADCRAAAVVLFHNHPSGDPSPSADDLALTRRLVDAGVLMGIEVLDHLVLADANCYSFKEAWRI